MRRYYFFSLLWCISLLSGYAQENETAFEDFFYAALKEKAIENYDKAVIALQECVALDSMVPVVYFELGKNYTKLKQYTDAELAFLEALDKDPDNEWFLLGLHKLYKQQHHHKKSIEILKKLVTKKEDYNDDLAYHYMKANQDKNALDILDNQDRIYGETEKRNRIRQKIQTKNVKTTVSSKKRTINNSSIILGPSSSYKVKTSNYLESLLSRYINNGDNDNAFLTANKLIKEDKTSENANMFLYQYHLKSNDIKKSYPYIKRILENTYANTSNKQQALKDLINSVEKQDQYQNYLDDAIALITNDNNSNTISELGIYYFQNNNPEKALGHFQKALKLNPENFKALQYAILIYSDKKAYDVVKDISQQAIELYPSQPMFYLNFGEALSAQKEYAKAVDILESGLDYIVEDTYLKTRFYDNLIKTYSALDDKIKTKIYRNKIKELKAQK